MRRNEKDKDFDKRKIPRQKTSNRADSDSSISFDSNNRHEKLPDIRFSDISTESLYEKPDHIYDRSKRHNLAYSRNITTGNYNYLKDLQNDSFSLAKNQKNANINQLQYHEYSKANKEKIKGSYQKREEVNINEKNADFARNVHKTENLYTNDENNYRIKFNNNNRRTSYKADEQMAHDPQKIDESMYKKEKMQKLNSYPKEEDKTLQDYFFEVINEEAKKLNLHPYFYTNIPSLTGKRNDDGDLESNKTNIPNNFSEYNEAVSSNEHMQDENKKRGRPRSRSIDYPISEYDENGMRIDPVTSAIDFRDELFIDPDNPGSKTFICPKKPKCKKTFPSLSRAKRHFIVHLGIKPFKCENPNCPKTFSRRDNMLQHYHKHCSATKKQNKNATDDAIE